MIRLNVRRKDCMWYQEKAETANKCDATQYEFFKIAVRKVRAILKKISFCIHAVQTQVIRAKFMGWSTPANTGSALNNAIKGFEVFWMGLFFTLCSSQSRIRRRWTPLQETIQRYRAAMTYRNQQSQECWMWMHLSLLQWMHWNYENIQWINVFLLSRGYRVLAGKPRLLHLQNTPKYRANSHFLSINKKRVCLGEVRRR